MATAQATTDHDEIRQWAEARGGHPARVKDTGSRNDPGVLRIDFPGFSGEDTLEEIGWDEFFEWFDRNGLALLLSEEEGNRFNKLVSRAATKSASRRAVKSSSSKGGAKKTSAKKAASRSTSRGAVKSSSSKGGAKKTSAKKAAGKSTSRGAVKSSSSKGSAKKTSAGKAASSKKAAPSKKAASKSSAKKSSAKKASSSKKSSSSNKSASKSSSKSTRRLAASKTRRPSSKKASSNTTTDRDEIRKWVEARGGFPAHVKATGRKRGDLGVLRIDYPGYSGRETLERIDWDDWFEAFDRNKLAFLYQDKKNSRFSKLVNR